MSLFDNSKEQIVDKILSVDDGDDAMELAEDICNVLAALRMTDQKRAFLWNRLTPEQKLQAEKEHLAHDKASVVTTS